MIEPMSAAALGSLITTICLATSGFFAVFFKGMSHSRCSKINACCFSCTRDVINADITTSEDDSDFDRASRS
jgi:hypothetical protein